MKENGGGAWNKLNIKLLPECYRLFVNYIGESKLIVPEPTCHYAIEPILNPVKYIGYYQDKNYFDKLLPQGTCPRTLIRKIKGFFYNADYERIILSEDVLSKVLNIVQSDTVIVKPAADTSSGIGVYLFRRNNDDWVTRNGKLLTIDFLEKKCGYDVILQEGVKQSDFMSHFNPTSVNTLRLSVYKSVVDDQCHVTNAIMRIGNNGSDVDNAHAGGRFVGVFEDGHLGHYTCDQYGVKQVVFNGINFSDEYVVPNYEAIKKFACQVGECVPHHRLLALDIAIKEDGSPVLIEYNIDGYSMWLFQFTTGPAFGKYTEEIIEYCCKYKDKARIAVYI